MKLPEGIVLFLKPDTWQDPFRTPFGRSSIFLGFDRNPRYELLEQQLGPLDPLDLDPLQGGLSISSNVEAEYDQLMKETRQELAVMRQPSAEDVAQKQRNAQQLRLQIETWAALVETRIHLEAPFFGDGGQD